MNDRDRMLDALLGPRGDELSCERCFEMIDEYVDHELEGRDPDAHVPGMRAHLQGCPACREDHEALLALAKETL